MNSQTTTLKHWYVLYTLPNYEKKVDSIFRKNEIASFLPLQKIVRKWSDRTKVIEVPLFPNYIFVSPSDREKFKVLDTMGVKHYITLNGRPVQVNDSEICNIKRMLESPSISLEQDLVKGDAVKICNGPFQGLNGILYKKRGQTRFCVRIEAINQVLSIDVCSTWLQHVNKS